MACESWPIAWPCDTPNDQAEQVALAEAHAHNTLWALSGRMYGVCDYRETYEVPRRFGCGSAHLDGTWELSETGRRHTCCRILLAQRPVKLVTEVKVNGAVWADGTWEANRRHLYPMLRHFATGSCSSLVDVSYRAGIRPPESVAAPMGELAAEFLKAICGQSCKLPSRVSSVSRQGTTTTFESAESYFTNGLTGLPIADEFIRAANPSAKPRVVGRVYSPDQPQRI